MLCTSSAQPTTGNGNTTTLCKPRGCTCSLAMTISDGTMVYSPSKQDCTDCHLTRQHALRTVSSTLSVTDNGNTTTLGKLRGCSLAHISRTVNSLSSHVGRSLQLWAATAGRRVYLIKSVLTICVHAHPYPVLRCVRSAVRCN